MELNAMLGVFKLALLANILENTSMIISILIKKVG